MSIGWWVHRDVYRESTGIAQGQTQNQFLALVDQLEEGAVPVRRSTVPYEIVATGRRAAVAYGGGMEEFDPGTRHVLPAPPKAELPAPPDEGPTWGYTTRPVRLPARHDSKPGDRFGKDGGTYLVMYDDVRADELSSDRVAALGVAADAQLRVYVVVLPHAAEDIAGTITEATDRLLLRAGLVSLVLIAAVAYFAVRIALRPVEAIRVLTASVTANDPRERVTVPAAGHEITALATTINTTLQRLDNAAAQQRRFVADAAHELRSPLTTLLASLEVALAYPERTDWPAAATTAARQTRRLQALAEDLLLLARLDTRTPMAGPETVDLTALASRLTEQYPLTERPLTLTCDSTAPAPAHGNPTNTSDCCATSSTTPPATPHTASRSPSGTRTPGSSSRCTTTDRGCPPRTPSASSNASSGSTTPAPATTAAPAWASPSPATWPTATEAPSPSPPGPSEHASSYASPKPPPQPRNDVPLHGRRMARRAQDLGWALTKDRG